jgi:hypothetical protein
VDPVGADRDLLFIIPGENFIGTDFGATAAFITRDGGNRYSGSHKGTFSNLSGGNYHPAQVTAPCAVTIPLTESPVEAF